MRSPSALIVKLVVPPAAVTCASRPRASCTSVRSPSAVVRPLASKVKARGGNVVGTGGSRLHYSIPTFG
jgi:hypothetical protein